ncbi:hypothetical protein FJ414_09560 [Mesorhizobium sp. B3-1-6]|uniref:hypothetical protein n=1 Tax=Mesorhizobium sp. B3-1-6 TaxID=2589895 RepID=UPI00112A1AE4|nr:hypothetical protein [Mesorhizobium sp. B3-1-6]TPI40095.1 hypothetical protein FJ414_09560 [Mesorhizobium sp. B3-1-6]
MPDTGDEVGGLDEPYKFGPATDIVELPVTWGLDDYPAFEVVAGWNQGYSNPRDIEEIGWDDFRYALENCKGGIYTLTMHPEFIGRGHRIMMLDRLIQRMKACAGVHFTTLGPYAAEWNRRTRSKNGSRKTRCAPASTASHRSDRPWVATATERAPRWSCGFPGLDGRPRLWPARRTLAARS